MNTIDLPSYKKKKKFAINQKFQALYIFLFYADNVFLFSSAQYWMTKRISIYTTNNTLNPCTDTMNENLLIEEKRKQKKGYLHTKPTTYICILCFTALCACIHDTHNSCKFFKKYTYNTYIRLINIQSRSGKHIYISTSDRLDVPL